MGSTDAATPTTTRLRDRALGGLALIVALAPALAAIGWYPGFVTQDGPSHLYNAHILARSLQKGSPFEPWYETRWEPLPNWAGHAVAMGLVATLPPRVADRVMTSLTLVALAAAVACLRWRVRGEVDARGALLAALLGLNVTWLLGFHAFLLGSALLGLTLGIWWSGRDAGWSPARASGLAGLVVLGYFCHLVSLGLTAVGIVVLEVATPAPDRGKRLGRAATSLVGLLPLAPLGWLYTRLMRQGGGLAPEWKHLPHWSMPATWTAQLTWVDPISLARKGHVPLMGGAARDEVAIAPVLWLALALGLGAWAAWRAGDGPRRADWKGWWALGSILLAGGVVTPDTLGATHGEYLPQRVVLLGLVALAPVPRLSGWWRGHAAFAALVVAWAIQSAIVWDYAATSERMAGAVLAAGPLVGKHQRVATLLTNIGTPFRANPLLHADCALGIDTGNILWSNYETRFYYFPVRFRDGIERPESLQLERLALEDDARSSGAGRRESRWESLLRRHHAAIDVVLTWGDDASLDAITARWFEPVGSTGTHARVHRRRATIVDIAENADSPD